MQFYNYTLDFDSGISPTVVGVRLGVQRPEKMSTSSNFLPFLSQRNCADYIVKAYNLYALFRLLLTNNQQHPFLIKIRYKLFTIPAYIRKKEARKFFIWRARCMFEWRSKEFVGEWMISHCRMRFDKV